MSFELSYALGRHVYFPIYNFDARDEKFAGSVGYHRLSVVFGGVYPLRFGAQLVELWAKIQVGLGHPVLQIDVKRVGNLSFLGGAALGGVGWNIYGPLWLDLDVRAYAEQVILQDLDFRSPPETKKVILISPAPTLRLRLSF